MEKLKFKLTTNNDVVMDLEREYFIKDDVINFSDESNIYRYNINKHIFNKENNESIMNIDMNKNIITFYNKELKKEVELPLDNNDLLIKDKCIKYTYEINDNDIINIIEISY